MKIPANVSRKDLRVELSKTLSKSLNGLKDHIKKKKLKKNIKKASKILLDGVKISKPRNKISQKNQPIAKTKKEKAAAKTATPAAELTAQKEEAVIAS